MIHDLFLKRQGAFTLTPRKVGDPKVIWKRASLLSAPLGPRASRYGREAGVLVGAPIYTGRTVTDYPNIQGIADVGLFEVW